MAEVQWLANRGYLCLQVNFRGSSLANGYNGYLPTPEHHRLGGYETWRARSSYLEVGASPRIVEQLLGLLHQLSKD
jgi:hypothetical protein